MGVSKHSQRGRERNWESAEGWKGGACDGGGQGSVEITFFSSEDATFPSNQVLTESFQSGGSEFCMPGVCSLALDKAIFLSF